MFQKILIPLDGSPLAEAALPYVMPIAKAYGSQVVLANVVAPPSVEFEGDFTGIQHPYLDQLTEEAKIWAAGYLQKVADRLAQAQVSVLRQDVLVGSPAALLISQIKRHAVDLVAIATHGRSGLGRVLLGSVADNLLHSTDVPLLVVRPPEIEVEGEIKLSSIIVPLDGSPLAESVLSYVKDMAKALSLTVTLVRAIPTVTALSSGPEYVLLPMDIITEMKEAAILYLDNVAQSLRNEGLSCTTEVVEGDTASAISEYARKKQNHLVAISSHGRSGIARAVMGSIADRLIRTSGDPVLVVRPKNVAD